MPGYFITFEGVEGSGKSTQVARLAEALRARGRSVVVSREPGGTPVGKVLRGILLDPSSPPLACATELFLLLADRAQHVREVVGPALDAGKIVLVDRFLDSTTAYQGYGRGFALDWLTPLNTFACQGRRPNLTVVLDLPVEEGLRRARARRRGSSPDQFEGATIEFHRRIRSGFLAIAAAEPDRVCIIPATVSADAVGRRVWDLVRERLAPAAA